MSAIRNWTMHATFGVRSTWSQTGCTDVSGRHVVRIYPSYGFQASQLVWAEDLRPLGISSSFSPPDCTQHARAMTAGLELSGTWDSQGNMATRDQSFLMPGQERFRAASTATSSLLCSSRGTTLNSRNRQSAST